MCGQRLPEDKIESLRAEFDERKAKNLSFTQTCAFNCNKKGREIALKWLQSEVKVEESEEK